MDDPAIAALAADAAHRLENALASLSGAASG
jgi:hypothetical protein